MAPLAYVGNAAGERPTFPDRPGRRWARIDLSGIVFGWIAISSVRSCAPISRGSRRSRVLTSLEVWHAARREREAMWT
jgi:hypothetical protein